MQALYLVAVQAIYNFVLRPWGTQTLLSFVTHFLQVNLELQSIMSELVSQTNYSVLNASTDCPSKVFSCAKGAQVQFKLSTSRWVDVTCTHGFLLQSDWYHQSQSQVLEFDKFPADVIPGSFHPIFGERTWEQLRLAAIQMKDVPPLTTYVLPL